MTAPFDPHRDWLGIEGGRAASNHYRLFGLKLFEADPRSILAAADAMIAHVASIDTAPDQRELVLVELRAAKLCLLNPAARAQYDATLRSQMQSTTGSIPVATLLGTAAPAAPPIASTPPTFEIVEHAVPEPTALSSSLWEDSSDAPREREPTPTAPAWQTPLAVLLGFLIAAALLSIGSLVVLQFRSHDDNASNDVGAALEPTATGPSQSGASPEANAPSVRVLTEERTDVPPLSRAADAAPAAQPGNVPPVAAPRASNRTATDVPAKQQSTLSFSRSINSARAALANRELDVAGRHLARARELAQLPADHDALGRLEALHVQLGRFEDAVRAGMPKFEAADELSFGDAVVSVIEVGPDTMALRVEGSRREYSPATLPGPIALIVAKAGADENAPASKMFLGAFHAVDPQGDRALARTLWESAATAGENVDDLMPLLDAAALAVEREPVPDAASRAAAEARVAREFAVTIKGARSPEQKRYLVEQLLAGAAAAQDPADRYALLSEACARAATAGDAPVALEAVDELARLFKVDAQALKTEALAKAGAAARGEEAARSVAERALALLDLVRQRDELAKTLALTAVTAARRTRDPELIQKATQRRREVERSAGK